MSASTISFGGHTLRRPGSYSTVDASGLETVGLSASGTVALIGTCVGGRPVSDIETTADVPRFSSPAAAQRFCRSGDLKEATKMALSPSSDPQIEGGAAQVVLLKVNPATRARAQLPSGAGVGLEVTAADWGEFSNQISVSIQDGTNKGKLITARFEDQTESVDNIGGDDVLSLSYRAAQGAAGIGYARMSADLTDTGLSLTGGLDVPGSEGARVLTEAGAFTAVSSDAADTTQTLTVIGLEAGAPVVRTAQLTGTAAVAVGDFDGGVWGAFLNAPCAGTVNVVQAGTNLSIASGRLVAGGAKLGAAFVADRPVRLASSAAGTETVYVVGATADGQTAVDAVQLTGAAEVEGAVRFTSLLAVITSAVPTANTVTLIAPALVSSHATQDSLQRLADFVNARQVANPADASAPFGLSLGLLTTLTELSPASLDRAVAVDVLHPVTARLRADGFFIEQALNTRFSLVNARVPEGAIGVPDNTPQPVFLSGGGEGAARFADWQAALNLLKQVDVSTIVPLTANPAVHAALKAHIDYMCGGVGRNERDGIVGGQNAAFTGPPSLREIEQQVTALNTRHLRFCAQNIERYDTEGRRRSFPPYFQAVLAAGMQAGSSVGEPLTRKIANCLSIQQDRSWNPMDDGERLIERGVLFMEQVDNVGRRWVRNVTTSASSNAAYTEASMNEAVNFSVYNLRTSLEFAVGQKGFLGTANALKGIALSVLGLLISTGVITGYRNLSVELVGDRFEVNVEIAPVSPVNFVLTSFHLYQQNLKAA